MELNQMLVRTLVIKFNRNITILNDWIKLRYGVGAVDPDAPKSWKYYMNISGQYHVTDTPMEIISLDTGGPIIFSPATLVAHPATAEAYTYRSRYYYALVKRYPDQEQLILGIMYPADIDHAIAAADGSIVMYPSQLVEPQEITLIQDLESYIQRYIVRWDVDAFGLTDPLYNAAQYAIMCLNLLPRLLNMRVRRCMTYEAHTFHIREYLASHGRLDRFMPYMTLKQSLWLYRNLRYIDRHSGRADQFQHLVQHVLTDRYIPLSDFSIRQLQTFDSKYYSNISVRRNPVNVLYNAPEKDYLSIQKLYAKEAPLTIGNPDYLMLAQDRITQSLKTSPSSIMQTKDVESSMTDYTNSLPGPLEAVLMRQWAYMSQHDLYSAYVTFKDPITSASVSLTSHDAFIYMYYIFLRSIGLKLTHMPPYVNLRYRGYLPPVSRLTSVVGGMYDAVSMATTLLAAQPEMRVVTSVRGFYTLSHAIYEDGIIQWYRITNTHELYRRGEMQSMVQSMYADEVISFDATMPISAWLNARSLPEYAYSEVQAQRYIFDIFKAATGYNDDITKSPAAIQKAMISIMEQLSSYSIQFIREINASNIVPVNWAAVRVGGVKWRLDGTYYVPVDTRVIETRSQYHGQVSISYDLGQSPMILRTESAHTYSILFAQTIASMQPTERTLDLYYPSFKIQTLYDAYDPVVSAQAKFSGWEYYLALTPEQQSSIKSIY